MNTEIIEIIKLAQELKDINYEKFIYLKNLMKNKKK